MKMKTVLTYLLAVIMVLILGSLAGWYFFLRTQTDTTIAESVARGFGLGAPEGNTNGSVSSASQEAATDASPAQSAQRPAQLWSVEPKPTSGHTFIGSGKNLRLRYVERASGYVLEADPETGQILRLTNTLMPKIYEALLSENGHVLERSLDTAGNITTFVGTIATSTSSASSSAKTLTGTYLAKNISSVSMHPLSGALFYVVGGQGGSAVMSAEWNGEKQKTLLESAIISWKPATLADGRTILVQAAADGVPGYSYEVRQGGVLNSMLGPVPGLVVRARPSSSAGTPNALLWSQSVGGVLSVFARVDQNATAVQIPMRTVADKCVWKSGEGFVAYCGVPQGSAGQNFLDNWYRGAAHSSDALWRIDAGAGTAEMLYTPPSNTPVDIENLTIDRGGQYLSFTNAADKSLWLFRLTK